MIDPELDALIFHTENLQATQLRETFNSKWQEQVAANTRIDITEGLPFQFIFNQLQQIKVADESIHLKMRNPFGR